MADHTFGATIDSLTLRNDEVTPEFVGHSAKKISMQVQNPEPYLSTRKKIIFLVLIFEKFVLTFEKF